MDATLGIAERRSRGEDTERDGLQTQKVERGRELVCFLLRDSVVQSMVRLESVDPQGRGCVRSSCELCVGERAPSHFIWEERRAEARDGGAGAAGQGDSAEARSPGRSVSLLGVHRPHELRPSPRQAARGADVRADRPPKTEAVDELDVQGILAFAERILLRASDLWVQASLDYRQRLKALFFPEGIAYDGIRFNRTAVTAPLLSYLAPSESADEKMVSLTFASWNRVRQWLSQVDAFRRAA